MLMLRADETFDDALADHPRLLDDVRARGFAAVVEAEALTSKRRDRLSVLYADTIGPAVVERIWPSLEGDARALVEAATGRHLVVRPFADGPGVHVEVLSERGVQVVSSLPAASFAGVAALGFELRGPTTTSTAMTVATSTVSRLAKEGHLGALRRLDLWGLGDPAPDLVAQLPQLTTLETLRVVGPFGVAGVRAAAKLPRLTTLALEGNIGDEGAAIVGAMRGLRWLRLVRAFPAASVKHLAGLGELRGLELPDADLPKTAVKTLAALGALTTLDLAGSPRIEGEPFARLLRGAPLIDVRLDAMGTLGAATLAALGESPKLARLSLRGVALGDDGLAAIARAPSLERLDVGACRLSPKAHEGLAMLHAASEVVLDDNPIGPALGALGGLERLRSVRASRCALDAGALEGLASAKALRRLSLAHNRLGSDAAGVVAQLSSVRLLDVEACGLGDSPALGALSQLSHLNASSNGCASAAAGSFAALPRLRWLFSWNNPLGADGAKQLGALVSPVYVNVKSCRLEDAGLAGWPAWPTLRQLIVADNPLGDACVPPLTKMRSLWHLNIAATKVTYEGARALAAALPECELFV